MRWTIDGCPECGGDLYLDSDDEYTCLMCARSWPRPGAQIVPFFLQDKAGPRNAPRMRLRSVSSERLDKSA